MRAADDDTPSLPEDAATLRVLLLETRSLVDTLSTKLGNITAERDALASHIARLHHLLLKLKCVSARCGIPDRHRGPTKESGQDDVFPWGPRRR